MIKIVLAEDHNIVRNGIKNLLEREGQFTIIGEALNGKEVLDLMEKGLQPDIVLADMNMPLMTGIELAEQLSNRKSSTRVILLTMLDHEKYVIKAFKAGAMGYLLKNISADELIFAIKHVCADGRYVCNELALRFLDRLVQIPDSTEIQNYSSIEFSKREAEVLALIADGYTNQEIADQLFTSKRTVEGHRQSMIDKTGVRNTAALVKFACTNGILG